MFFFFFFLFFGSFSLICWNLGEAMARIKFSSSLFGFLLGYDLYSLKWLCGMCRADSFSGFISGIVCAKQNNKDALATCVKL